MSVSSSCKSIPRHKKKGSKEVSPPTRNIAVPAGHLLVNDKYNDYDHGIFKLMKDHVNIVVDSHLGLIDFYPSNNCGVLYFKENDLIDTICWKEKLRRLMNSPLKVIILAEKTQLNDQYYDQLQTLAVIELGMVLLPVFSPLDAANYLTNLVIQESRPRHCNKFLMKRKPEPVNEAVISTLKQLPGVGESKAKLLLNCYGGIAGIACASLEELTETIGSSGAMSVKSVF